MWSRFDKLNVTTVDAFSQNDTTNEIERISTIAGSLASIGTERTETLVKNTIFSFPICFLMFSACKIIKCISFLQHIDERVYDTDHTDLNSDFDESELRRELLKDVMYSFIFTPCIG